MGPWTWELSYMSESMVLSNMQWWALSYELNLQILFVFLRTMRLPSHLLSSLVLRDRIGDPIMIGRFLDFFPIISDARFLSVRSEIGRFFCVCTIHDKYK